MYILNECFLNWYKSEMNAWLELVVKVNSMGRYFKKLINLKRFYFTVTSWWDHGCRNRWIYDGIRFFASWKKQIKGVNQNWLIGRSHCFKWWFPICLKTYHQKQISVAPWSIFTTRSSAEKQITGNEKNF